MKGSFFSWIWIFTVITGCAGSPDYKQMEEKELTSGKRVQDIFYDIKFGMARKDFFTYCWEMHQKGKFLDGENSTSVLYKIDSGLRYPASMNFYPNFYNGKINKMQARFEYVAWAPWNKALFSDSLILDLVQLYQRWYPGNDFMKLTNSKGRTIYVKVDGNRRIILGQIDDARVKADYTDLVVERQLKK